MCFSGCECWDAVRGYLPKEFQSLGAKERRRISGDQADLHTHSTLVAHTLVKLAQNFGPSQIATGS